MSKCSSTCICVISSVHLCICACAARTFVETFESACTHVRAMLCVNDLCTWMQLSVFMPVYVGHVCATPEVCMHTFRCMCMRGA